VEYVNKKHMKTIVVDGVEYIKKTEATSGAKAKQKKGLTYCIVRTYSAGVWAGWVDLKNYGEQMKVTEARRLWRWWSEFTLSALATTGIKEGKEEENKYAMPVEETYLTNVIEIIPCTEKAQSDIVNQPNYKE
jgi:hypothetical protein